jgi:hypothetical protein
MRAVNVARDYQQHDTLRANKSDCSLCRALTTRLRNPVTYLKFKLHQSIKFDEIALVSMLCAEGALNRASLWRQEKNVRAGFLK